MLNFRVYFCVLSFKDHNGLPENKIISVELGKLDALKKYMKKAMPFVQATREKMALIGIQALSLTMEFDEAKILRENSSYLANTLDVCFLYNKIYFS